MTEDYGIAIRVTANDAVTQANAAAAALGKAEVAGERAGQAVSRAMTIGGAATERTRDSMGRFVTVSRASSGAVGGLSTDTARLITGLGRAGLAFDGVMRAIQREQQMLERIRGPARAYEQHLQTLDSLLDRNRISTAEYANEVSKLNRQLERSQGLKPASPAAAPRPAAGGGGGGGGGGLLSGAGGLAGAAASAGLALGAREVLSMASSYQDLQNKMRVVAGDGESVSTVFSRIQASANASRSSLADTTAAYQRLTGATRELGMSSADTLRLTERISKAMKVSGASTSEAQAATQQLSQALASGLLQGDEFRSIGENAPYVLGLLAEALGVTRGKLRELASEGKLTSSVVVGAFEKMGSKIDKDFAKTAPTLTDQWSMLQDKLMLVIGKVFEASGTFAVLGGALGAVGDVLGVVTDIFGGLKTAVDDVKNSLGPLGDIAGATSNPFASLTEGLAMLRRAAEEEARAEKDFEAVWGNRGKLQQEISRQQAEAYLAEMAALKKLHAEYERIDKIGATLDAARRGGAQGLPDFDVGAAKRAAETAQAFKQAFGVDVSGAFDEAFKKGQQLADGVSKLKEQRSAALLAEDIRRATDAATGFNKTLDDNEKRWRSLVDQERESEQALQKIAQTRALIAAARGADPLVEMTSGSDALSRTRLELQAQRELRDVKLEMSNVEYEYGATVVRVTKAEQERVDSMNDLKGALEGGRISARAFLDEVRRYGDAAGESLDLMIKGLEAAADKLAAARPAPLAPSRQEVEARRQARDLTIQQTYAEHQYGAAIVKSKLEELHRKDQLEDTRGAFAAGGMTAKQYEAAMKGLGIEVGRATDLLKEIRQPAIDFQENVAALNALLSHGRITLDEYGAAMRRVTDAYGGSELRQLLESAGASKPQPKVSLGGGEVAGGLFDDALEIDALEIDANVSRERADALKGYREEVERLTDEIERVRPDGPSLDADLAAAEKSGQSMAQVLERIKGAATEYNRGLRDSQQLLADGAITTREYETEIRRLEEAYFGATHAGQSFEDGLARGIRALRDEILDIGSQIESTLKNAFSGAEDALVSFVTTGEINFKRLVDSMLADLTRLLLRQAFAGIIGAISGGGIPSVLGGNASKGIPGFAGGGEGRIAGSGPPDSRLFIARVTPGEHFRFTPPGQSPSSSPPPVAPPQVRVVVIDNEDKLRRFMENQGEGYHHVFERRSSPAKRGRATGR